MLVDRRKKIVFIFMHLVKGACNTAVELEPLHSWWFWARSHDNKESEQLRCLRVGQSPSGRYITVRSFSRLNMYEAGTEQWRRAFTSTARRLTPVAESKSSTALVIKGRLV
jgi:hypothetical protein